MRFLRPLLIYVVLLAIAAASWGQKPVPKPKIAPQMLAQLNNALFDAAEAKDLQQMEKLLTQGANPNARDLRGYDHPERRHPSADQKALLFATIEVKSLPEIRLLISHGANVNAETDANLLITQERDVRNLRPAENMTALEWATKLNQAEIVKLLIHSGAQLPAANQDSYLISLAAAYNSLDAAHILLDAGVSPNLRTPFNRDSPLFWAVVNRHTDMVKLLIEHGAQANNEALVTAIKQDDLDSALALLENGATPRPHDSYNDYALQALMEHARYAFEQYPPVDSSHLSPEEKEQNQQLLENAAASRQKMVDVLRKLLEKGADPNQKFKDNSTPLLQAINYSIQPYVQILLDNGANPNLISPPFPAPLRFLARYGVSGGLADSLDQSTTEKLSPSEKQNLVSMREMQDLNLARALVEKGANLGSGDNRYALGEAALAGNRSLVEFLLQQGADPNLPLAANAANLTIPLGFHSDAERILLIENKTLRVKNQTPLMLAANGGYLEVVRQLLKEGAKVDTVDSLGRNALHYLALRGRTDTIVAAEKINASIVDGVWNYNLSQQNIIKPLPASQMHLLSSWASTGDGAITCELLSKGCDANQKDRSGQTPLQIALQRSDLSVVDAMLQAGIKPSKTTSLFDVIQNGRRESRVLPALTKLQLDLIECDRIDFWSVGEIKESQKGHDPEAKRGRIKAIFQRNSLLNLWGNADAQVVAQLIKSGASINAKNSAGLTPLMLAARLGQIEVARELIKAGADMKATTRNGETIPAQVTKAGLQNLKNLPVKEEVDTGPMASSWCSPVVLKRRQSLIRWTLKSEDDAMLQLLRSAGAP